MWGKGEATGEPGHCYDPVQSSELQQGELPVDQVCGEVPPRLLRPPVPQPHGLPGGGEREIYVECDFQPPPHCPFNP